MIAGLDAESVSLAFLFLLFFDCFQTDEYLAEYVALGTGEGHIQDVSIAQAGFVSITQPAAYVHPDSLGPLLRRLVPGWLLGGTLLALRMHQALKDRPMLLRGLFAAGLGGGDAGPESSDSIEVSTPFFIFRR